MTSESCLEYALRVACLQVLIDQRARQPPPAPPPNPSTPSSATQTPSRRSYQDGGSGHSFRAFDFSSLIGRDSSKSPKYPEKMLKVMDVTLQRIAMGQEPKFSDQRFRRTAAMFWNSPWPDKAFQKQMRESRKIEDLILPFVTTATKSLKKEEELADGAWKFELNTQIALFLDLLADSLAAVGPSSGELTNRLESYRQRLREPAPNSTAGSIKEADRNSLVVGSDRGHGGDAESTFSTRSAKADGFRGKETEEIGQLFGLSDDQLQAKLNELKTICTERAALEDLKSCLKRLNTDNPIPYGPNDFSDPAQWTIYRAGEVSTLSQMMLLMMQANPTLAQTSERHSTGGDLSARVDSLRLDGPTSSFTYVPSDPRSVYRDLLDRCLEWDLEVLSTLPEDEDVSLGVLSQEHMSLLGECAVRWRLPASFRAWVFLSAIVERFEQGNVPSACVHEATAMVAKVSAEASVDTWATSDRQGLEAAMAKRDLCFFSAIDSSLSYASDGYHSADFYDAVSDWLVIGTQETTSTPAMAKMTESIVSRIRSQAFESYISEAGEKMDLFEGGRQSKGFAMAMSAWVEKEAKKLNKKFGDPVADGIDVVPLVITQQLSLWLRDLEDAMSQLGPGQEEDEIEEAFGLFRKAQKMINLGNAFSNDPIHFSLAPVFEPIVKLWLDKTALKTKQWADQALAVDNFEPSTEYGPSSSVTDLFDSFRSASTFIMDLDWPDEQQLAYFAMRLAKIFSLSIHDYCAKMEQLFAEDMRADEAVQPAQAAAKQKAWIEKAKSTLASLQGEKKLQAFFNFTPTSCVKLNNIEAARQQLDKLYQDMRVDDLSAYETSEPPPTPNGQVYLFTVKILLAEGLNMDGTSNKLPDSFVIISDEHGNRYAKTRTIYDDADPRWDETFDIPVRGDGAWFMATIRHRVLGPGKHDLLGRAYLRLDPNQYNDLISKDVLLPLDTRGGHLLLRVSMEGERDDIQYHFGRAFRWLKRTEGDMVRTFVDKMTPVLRHTLSRSSIKSVLKPGNSSLNSLTTSLDYNEALGKISAAYRSVDYNEALGKLSAAYRSALGTPEYSIPLPPREERSNGGIPPSAESPVSATSASAVQRRKPPTDAEIESAIHPLFDYLDANNHTLASTLSKDAMQSVMAKLWKQILMTIESLIVPPLSDKPSHMRALSDGELDIALKWLKFLRDFFYVGGDESGVPLNILQNAKFNEILSVRIYYDWRTDDLMEECIRGFQNTLKYRATRPSKSLLSQRNLGTIKARKSAKRATPAGAGNTEMIMRILRMRQGTQEFLAQQIQIMSVVKLDNPKKGKSLMIRR